MYHTPHTQKNTFEGNYLLSFFFIKVKHSCAAFLKIVLFIYVLFLAALSLCCCVGFSLLWRVGAALWLQWPLLWRAGSEACRHQHVFSCGGRAPRHAASARVLLWRAGSEACRISTCGTWTQLLCDTWDLPRSGVKPVSPALAGGFSTTELPGKPLY